MKAIGIWKALPADDREALVEREIPVPVPGPDDLLVRVEAVSVNPADIRTRMRKTEDGHFAVLGWDVAGKVVATGAQVRDFAPGDRVLYAGDLSRPGANSEYHLVEHAIVGHRPEALGPAAAAALPLTALTAWEALFDRLEIARPVPGAAKAVLIVGGAGGVASMAVQLARKLTDFAVIATASRPESRAWIEALGAHHVIDHRQPLAAQVAALGLGAPGCVFSTTHTGEHLPEIAKLIAPQGRIALIDDPERLDILPLKRKSVSVHWEFMYTRSMFATADLAEQGRLLTEVARLVDARTLRTTVAENFGRICAENLKRAHALLESETARGKIVLEGF